MCVCMYICYIYIYIYIYIHAADVPIYQMIEFKINFPIIFAFFKIVKYVYESDQKWIA